MERYQVQKTTNGQYKIVDTSLNLAVAWLERKAPADRACKHINQNYKAQLAQKT